MQVGQADAADCEAQDGWFFAQDVNSWSSLAYVIVGLAVAVAAVQWRVPRVFLALGVAITIEGVGSLLYHGIGGDAGQLLHDAALVATLGFITGWHVGRLAGGTDTGAWLGLVAGLVVGVVAGFAGPVVTNSAVAAGVVVIVVSELVARRRGLATVWSVGILVLVAAALVAWGFGRSDSPLCAARSWAQPHAVWHILSALAILAWVDWAAAQQTLGDSKQAARR